MSDVIIGNSEVYKLREQCAEKDREIERLKPLVSTKLLCADCAGDSWSKAIGGEFSGPCMKCGETKHLHDIPTIHILHFHLQIAREALKEIAKQDGISTLGSIQRREMAQKAIEQIGGV